DPLRQKVEAVVTLNPYLRSAIPLSEALNTSKPLPSLPERASLLAADGSQINPDRHGAIDYCLVNVGAIQMMHGTSDTPGWTIRSRLLYDEEIYIENGRITERLVALMRDLGERQLLAELAAGLPEPILTLTDGPLELWMGRDGDAGAKEFEKRFKEYLDALEKLKQMGASTAGYIDKHGGDLLVRLLEIAALPVTRLDKAGRERSLRGVTDADLLRDVLKPNERSAVFGIQSRNAGKYSDKLALHFFYLSVGKTIEGRPYLARVEVPGWVANSPKMLDDLHAILIHQCQILGSRPYPYLLHRSHEVALVTMDEKQQVEQMITIELRRRGITVGQTSNKQFAKDASGQRTRFP
ncbi:MAG: DNA double-strand break repair nuclease NurA, partial [Anaerolineales bacterium]